MANPRSFKSDASFLEKISMGAAGTRKVIEDLSHVGHRPIELERGSTTYKIWKQIKIKRIRVPDVLCIQCGQRVESRAKTKLEISMSHSSSDPQRGWDFGLRDDDYVALVPAVKTGSRPIDWEAGDPVQYLRVQALREAQRVGQVILVKPKGAEEGFEARISWPAAVAHSAGAMSLIAPDRIQYVRETDHRTISLSLSRRGCTLIPLVAPDERIRDNQIISSVVPVTQGFPCSDPVPANFYLTRLSSPSLSERYAAAKALSHFPASETEQALVAKSAEPNEHLYVRLEAAAALARHNNEHGWAFVEATLSDPYAQNRLEAVIILAEIHSPHASALLRTVLTDHAQHPEIRAGAAWALGEVGGQDSLDSLVGCFLEVEEDVRIEAARALAKLARTLTPDLLERFRSQPNARPGIAWALSESARFTVGDLLPSLGDQDSRQWIAFILGSQEPASYLPNIEGLRSVDPEVYFAVTVLWKIMSSWVFNLEEYG